MTRPARLLLAAAVAVSFAVAAPAGANDCSNPKQPCGGCTINRGFSTEDPRPVVCYV